MQKIVQPHAAGDLSLFKCANIEQCPNLHQPCNAGGLCAQGSVSRCNQAMQTEMARTAAAGAPPELIGALEVACAASHRDPGLARP